MNPGQVYTTREFASKLLLEEWQACPEDVLRYVMTFADYKDDCLIDVSSSTIKLHGSFHWGIDPSRTTIMLLSGSISNPVTYSNAMTYGGPTRDATWHRLQCDYRSCLDIYWKGNTIVASNGQLHTVAECSFPLIVAYNSQDDIHITEITQDSSKLLEIIIDPESLFNNSDEKVDSAPVGFVRFENTMANMYKEADGTYALAFGSEFTTRTVVSDKPFNPTVFDGDLRINVTHNGEDTTMWVSGTGECVDGRMYARAGLRPATRLGVQGSALQPV